MFFFIGGVQPKTIDLDEPPRRCPSCGLYQARLKRMDHYISLFFIPLIRIKKGDPFLLCERCGFQSPDVDGDYSTDLKEGVSRTCPHCGKPLESDFQYCPFCGRQL